MFDLPILVFLFIFKKTKQWLIEFIRLIFVHFSEFFTYDQDPIKDCASLDEITQLKAKRPLRSVPFLFSWLKISLHFVPPLLSMIYFHLDNLYEILVKGYYDPKGMPELLLHRISQKIFWDIMDVVLSTGMLQELLIFGYLTVRPTVHPDNFMFAVWNESTKKRTIYYRGKFWKQSKSDQLLKRRSQLKRVYTILVVTVFCQLYLYYTLNHYLNGNLLSGRNIWLSLYMHAWCVYTAYADAYVAFYFHLNANYLAFKQQCKLHKLSALIEEVALVKRGLHPNKDIPQLRRILWAKFCKENGKMLTLCKELAEYNRFWSFPLSVYVYGYVINICFLGYGMLAGEMDYLKRSFYAFFCIQFLGTILFITLLCSIIVRRSVLIYQNNCRFAFLFCESLKPTRPQQLKLSKIVSNFKGSKVGFRYITNGLIDSRMFEILIISISVLFMKLFKHKLMGEDFIG